MLHPFGSCHPGWGKIISTANVCSGISDEAAAIHLSKIARIKNIAQQTLQQSEGEGHKE